MIDLKRSRQMQMCIASVVFTLFLASCTDKGWQPKDTILLDGIAPIGITHWNDEIWLSDGDNNRLVVIDENGEIVRQVGPIERPMHLISRLDKMYIPSYGQDEIYVFGEASVDTIRAKVEMEGPGGVDVVNGFTAIADFYNHQVVTYDGSNWNAFGGKGKADGEMHYPTDIQIEGDKLWVADAYNNRIQVFSLEGKHILTFGQELKMNAATGIYVTSTEVFITDFENSRLFVFDHDGKVLQEINTGLDKPTDVFLHDDILWVLNYQGKYITRYTS